VIIEYPAHLKSSAQPGIGQRTVFTLGSALKFLFFFLFTANTEECCSMQCSYCTFSTIWPPTAYYLSQ